MTDTLSEFFYDNIMIHFNIVSFFYPRGQFLLYEAEDGQIKINVRLSDETVFKLSLLKSGL